MKPKDWFTVGVRLIGVWWLVEAAQESIYLASAELGYLKSSIYTPGNYAVHAVGNLLVGLFLISGAQVLVAFAGDWNSENDSSDDDAKNTPLSSILPSYIIALIE